MRLDARLTFDRLVVGGANRLAAAAARAVAESPGTAYNPLFIYGASGLGKTHLLTATAHLLQRLQPGAEVVALTMDEFNEQFHAAVGAGETSAYAQRLARVDLLLLDDLQFLSGRRETQAALLRVFTTMQANDRQVVCASDRPPAEIVDVDERLISRLAGGLVVDVGVPEFEARVAILRASCAEQEWTVPDEALADLAGHGIVSVRELRGLLNQYVAQQALGASPGPHVTPRAGAVDALTPSGEFLSFLSDVAAVVQEQVESWQVRLREVIAYWKAEGYRTAVLERALALPTEPDVPGLIATYVQAVEHLRALEAESAAADRSLSGHELFRDPERLAEAEDLAERALAGEMPPTGPNAAFTRGAFDVGTSNQLAVHAADAIAMAPATRYNPVLITGPSGVGKTHLAHAIGNAIAEATGAPVACVHAQALVDELILAIQQGTVDRWRSRYRQVGALIVDDVQFLAGKERTQDEFFFVFNALIEEGRQIVLTSDRLPAEIPELAARLRSRFEGGLIAQIAAPDHPLREKLAARFLAALGRGAPPDLLDVICAPAVQSVRELIGVVQRLVAAADVTGAPLDAAFARAELGLASADLAGAAPPAAAAQADDRTFLDRERVVWEWSDVGGRAIEELG